jgi:cytochrome c-type biogenesis protein CcmF
MIVVLGHFAVILALITSVVQAAMPLIGASRGNHAMMHAGRRAAYVSCGLIVMGFLALMFAHVTDDFSVMNVVLNSHTQKPLLYKITGTWASHEGSMLLWVLILTSFGAALARYVPDMPLLLRARAVGVQGLTGVGFLAFILFTSDPFLRASPVPLEGNDLNPLLQDPGLAFHPPFLYVGYVGFSSMFSLAAALLMAKNMDATWAKWLRPWALASWASLTFGIAMGSWWAYYELGWGGWWFWDPVENAALLPWLAGTALVHSLVASAQRAALIRWTILLAIVTFSLSLLGTFLVRSGILTSVHTFAVDPARGVFVLLLLALAVGGALTLYALRAHMLPESPLFAPVSRETFLLLNNLFLCTACATLLTGTLYPLLLNAINGGIVSVGPPYFNAVVVPLLVPVFLLMVVGPMLPWEKGDLRAVVRQLRFACCLAMFGLGAGLYLFGFKSILGLVALTFGCWVVAGTLKDAQRQGARALAHLPRLLAHSGLGIAILGMAGSAFSEDYALTMQPSQSADVGGYHIEFTDLQPIKGPNYDAQRGIFNITRGDFSVTMRPEQRFYQVQAMALSDVAIHTNLLSDLYLSLGDEQENTDGSKSRVVRFHINPLVPWIWIGGTVMALGGVIGALQKKRLRMRPA